MKWNAMMTRVVSGILSVTVLSTVIVTDTDLIRPQETTAASVSAEEYDDSEAVQIASTAFSISDVTVSGGIAAVSYYAEEACTIVVGFYNDAGTKLLTSCRQTVAASGEEIGDTVVSIPLPADVPEYYLLKAFILDDMQVPLGNPFSSTYYTKGVADIKNAKITDYDETYAVNLDGDPDNNFFVLNEDVIRIAYDGKNNLLSGFDGDEMVYEFTNADSRMQSLKPGNVVFCDAPDMENMALFTVSESTGSGTSIRITAAEMDFEDAFELVKIDYLANADFDPEECAAHDGVAYLGTQMHASRSSSGGVTVQDAPFSGTIPIEHTFQIPEHDSDSESGGDSDFEMGIEGDATVTLSAMIRYEILWSAEAQYLKFDIDTTTTYESKIEINASYTQPLYGFNADAFKKQLGGIVDFALDIGVRFEGSSTVEINGECRMDFTIQSDAPNYLLRGTDCKGTLVAKGQIFIGLVAEAKIGIGKKKNGFLLGAEAKAGLELRAEAEFGTLENHECNACFSGAVHALAGIEVTAKLQVMGIELGDTYEPFKWNPELYKCYYSFTFHEFGSGVCPHKTTPLKFISQAEEDKNNACELVLRKNNTVVFDSLASDTLEVSLPVDNDNNNAYTYEFIANGLEQATGSFQCNGEAQTYTATIKTRESAYPADLSDPVFPNGYGDEKSPNYLIDYFEKPGVGRFYHYSDGHATLIKLDAATGGVVPRSVDGYLVTQVAFQTMEDFSAFTDITLPDTLVRSGEATFTWDNLHNTGTVTVLAPTDHIPDGYFTNAYMSQVNLPDTVTNIGMWGFIGAKNLTSIEIPDSVTYIERHAFEDCTGLTSVQLPSALPGIAASSFKDCSALTDIPLPATVKYIGMDAFMGCNGLTTMSLPSALTYIGCTAFENCLNLTEIEIPASVEIIDLGAFNACTNLKKVTFAEGLKRIGESAFANTAITSIELPDSVECIGPNAFANMSALTSMTLPKHNSFTVNMTGTPNLTDIYYRGTAYDWEKEDYSETFWEYGDQITVHFLEEEETPASNVKRVSYAAAPLRQIAEIDTAAAAAETETVSRTVTQMTVLPNGSNISTTDGLTQIDFRNTAAQAKYLLLAVGSAGKDLLDSSNLRYIDQQTADQDGALTFSFETLPEDTVYIIVGELADDAYFRYEGTLDSMEQVRRGDVNLDGETDVSDAVLLARYLAEDYGANISDAGRLNADCDGVTGLDYNDVIYILRMIVQLV